MGLLNTLLGFFKFEVAPAGTKKDLTACNISEAHLQTDLAAANAKLGTANSALGVCTQDGTVQQQTIAQQANTIQSLTDQLDSLSAQVARTRSVFAKPCPAGLVQVAPAQVMLGEFITRTATREIWCEYPNHPALFCITPFYEDILNAVDCNRQRLDLTSIQICMKIANACQARAVYTTDQQQWGEPDDWHPGFFVLLTGTDDCETLALNICCAIKYYEAKFGAFADVDVLLGLGHLIEGTNAYGHGFVVVKHLTSTAPTDSYIIEATLTYEANPMSFQEATTTYQIDWGLNGFIRLDYKDGTYHLDPTLSWWGASGPTNAHVQNGCKCRHCMKARGEKFSAARDILSELKRVFTGELDDEEKKMVLIAKIYEPRRVRK